MLIAPLQAQNTNKKEIILQLTIKDHENRPLTGMLRVDISVTGAGSRQLPPIYLLDGYIDLPVELNIQEQGSGTIKVYYYPAEEPLSGFHSTPIREGDRFKFTSERLEYYLPENNQLHFKLSLDYKEKEVISTTKNGAVQEISRSQQLSSTTKALAEVGADLWIFSAKTGVEMETGESETNTLTDSKMTESEKGVKYVIRYPTGSLSMKQMNAPHN